MNNEGFRKIDNYMIPQHMFVNIALVLSLTKANYRLFF